MAPTFLPGDMVAVWRMVMGGGIPGKRAHHRWKPGVCMGSVRGNNWIAFPGSVVKTSPEQLRPAAREESHAWRLADAQLRTMLVKFGEFSGHRFEDTTNGERLQVRRKILWKKGRLYHMRPTRQVVEESLEKPRLRLKILTRWVYESRLAAVEWRWRATAYGKGDITWNRDRPIKKQRSRSKTQSDEYTSPSAASNTKRNHLPSRPSPSSRDIFRCFSRRVEQTCRTLPDKTSQRCVTSSTLQPLGDKSRTRTRESTPSLPRGWASNP